MSTADNHNTSKQIALPLLLAITLAVGILLGLYMSDYDTPHNKVQEANNKYGQILNLIERDYVDTVDVKALNEEAIEFMLRKLDPHTVYIPSRDIELAQSSLETGFEGVGIEFTIIRDTLFVLNTIHGGPSYFAGIKSGDKLVEVDGKSITSEKLDTREIFKLLRGKEGSVVNVGVIRYGKPDMLHYDITRAKIPTSTIGASYMINKHTGYIKLDRFAEDAHAEFLESLNSLLKEGMAQLILDLRDNGGGYLEEAHMIVDEFLPRGRLIVYTKGKQVSHNKQYKAKKPGAFEEGEVIILMNESSASASEIVAGALQDNDRALIVGRRSFGKGLVQRPCTLDDGSQLRITISRYYTPSNRCIQKPYMDNENYEDDYQKRLESGELFSADSIKLNDTLKYKTLNGRLVYGGGGILPDDFVPKDTSEYSAYLEKLFTNQVLSEFAIFYANEHHLELERRGFQSFASEFEFTKKDISKFILQAQHNGVLYHEQQFLKSQALIFKILKSTIARNVWGKNEQHFILNNRDPFIHNALRLFPKSDKILSGIPE